MKLKTVDCRVGSLEIKNVLTDYFASVDCRIGSLEIKRTFDRRVALIVISFKTPQNPTLLRILIATCNTLHPATL